jgi:ankyrin repeat protein
VLIDGGDPVAVAATAAIQAGDVAALTALLAEHPGLATASVAGDRDTARTLLHLVTDWPGHRPHGPALVAALVAAGADVDARFTGPHPETPLHWAASCDDVAVLDALLDAGADIDAGGAVIAGSTPLADAVAFGQWQTARRLVDRGARTELWQESALGLLDRMTARFAGPHRPTADEVTGALWTACHGGQRPAAELLLSYGADLDRVGWDGLTPLGAATRAGATDLAAWLRTRS